MSLLYIAGMYYNDVCDVEHDRVHQPHRPIPVGLISYGQAKTFALLYVLIALLLDLYRTHDSTGGGRQRKHWLVDQRNGIDFMHRPL